MTDQEILEIEDCLTARVDALQALLRTEKQKAALSSLWESMVEWRDAYLEFLGELAEEEASEKEASEEEVKKVRMELPITDEHMKKLLEKNSFDMKSSESLLLETNVDEITKIKQVQGNVRGDVVSLDDLFTREFRRALTKLFHDEKDPVEIIRWKDIFETLEDTLDACEHLADTVEGVMMKNA